MGNLFAKSQTNKTKNKPSIAPNIATKIISCIAAISGDPTVQVIVPLLVLLWEIRQDALNESNLAQIEKMQQNVYKLSNEIKREIKMLKNELEKTQLIAEFSGVEQTIRSNFRNLLMAKKKKNQNDIKSDFERYFETENIPKQVYKLLTVKDEKLFGNDPICVMKEVYNYDIRKIKKFRAAYMKLIFMGCVLIHQYDTKHKTKDQCKYECDKLCKYIKNIADYFDDVENKCNKIIYDQPHIKDTIKMLIDNNQDASNNGIRDIIFDYMAARFSDHAFLVCVGDSSLPSASYDWRGWNVVDVVHYKKRVILTHTREHDDYLIRKHDVDSKVKQCVQKNKPWLPLVPYNKRHLLDELNKKLVAADIIILSSSDYCTRRHTGYCYCHKDSYFKIRIYIVFTRTRSKL